MLRQRPAREWLERFRAAGVPASLVAITEEMAGDEQAKANGILMPAGPEVGVPWVINHPVRLEGVAERGPTRPPAVGEHSDEILAELGLGRHQIDELRRNGVV